ncbi:hypothetical protein ACVW0Y_001754, partial [Pseudomonas sp. TE3786]
MLFVLKGLAGGAPPTGVWDKINSARGRRNPAGPSAATRPRP